ncbi:hypothetical protein K438DRAFT_2002917 [Mycena galopus ATCC 62051]|nr:hypothetical protein K438DRAFT_2002917 [Mycena galopus ATCC 62051]
MTTKTSATTPTTTDGYPPTPTPTPAPVPRRPISAPTLPSLSLAIAPPTTLGGVIVAFAAPSSLPARSPEAPLVSTHTRLAARFAAGRTAAMTPPSTSTQAGALTAPVKQLLSLGNLPPPPLCIPFSHCSASYSSLSPFEPGAWTCAWRGRTQRANDLTGSASDGSTDVKSDSSTSAYSSTSAPRHPPKILWSLGGTQDGTSDAGQVCILRASQTILATALGRVRACQVFIQFLFLVGWEFLRAGVIFCGVRGTSVLEFSAHERVLPWRLPPFLSAPTFSPLLCA